MLSPGTRIGPHRVESWVGEGATGQSYKGEKTEGDRKKENFYIKLLPREISEKRGFEDLFIQECQALEQVDGPGIWPLQKFGVMKWKHWVVYDWNPGKSIPVDSPDFSSDCTDLPEEEFHLIYSLEDDLEYDPLSWTQDSLLSLMITLHRALYHAHGLGFLHGNLKPSNILILRTEGEKVESWITEFGLYRLVTMTSKNNEQDGTKDSVVSTLEAQDSKTRSADFRPTLQAWGEEVDEKCDLYALGQVVHEIIKKGNGPEDVEEWKAWADTAVSGAPFESAAHSMAALPGVGDISEYGVKLEDGSEISDEETAKIRKEREQEWAFEEKTSNLRFKRNMTGLIGGLFILVYAIKSTYLFFLPAPWTEYSLAGLLDSYQLAAGLWSGQSWGILPSAYDEEGEGGQDVVGIWEKDDGLFRLDFRKFKMPEEKGDAKKRWQFIGKGATSDEDYHIWSDYLSYDRSRDALLLVKRNDGETTFKPGKEEGRIPQLYPESRFFDNSSKVRPAELVFARKGEAGISWELFIGLGFLLSYSMYLRNLNKVILDGPEAF
jgi:serine/threonine protein kinase